MTTALKSKLFLSLRFWVTGSFNVAIPTLDSREAPYSSPFCEEKQHPVVEGDFETILYIIRWENTSLEGYNETVLTDWLTVLRGNIVIAKSFFTK